MTYEQARDELVTVVQRLEAGDQTLEESLELWERGEALAARCQQWLDGARERLEAARAASPTPPTTTPRAEELMPEHEAPTDTAHRGPR